MPISDSPDNATKPEDTIGIVEEEENFKVCADCCHLLGVRYNTDRAEERWHCCHKNNIHEDNKIGWKVDLVTGLKYRVFKLAYSIYAVRQDHCKGDWYEKYVPPIRESAAPVIGGLQATEIVFDEATLASNATAAADRVKELKARKLKKALSPTDPDLDKL